MISPSLAFGLPNGGDLLVIAVLALVLFGSRKLPYFFQSLGRSMSEFRRVKEEYEEETRRKARQKLTRETDRFFAFCSLIFAFSLGVLVFALLRRVHL